MEEIRITLQDIEDNLSSFGYDEAVQFNLQRVIMADKIEWDFEFFDTECDYEECQLWATGDYVLEIISAETQEELDDLIGYEKWELEDAFYVAGEIMPMKLAIEEYFNELTEFQKTYIKKETIQ